MQILNVVMPSLIEYRIVIAALITVIVETIVILFYKGKTTGLIITVILMNLVSNMLMNYLLRLIPYGFDSWTILITFEIFVVFIEAVIYFPIVKKFSTAFLLSLSANTMSLLIGLFLIPYIY